MANLMRCCGILFVLLIGSSACANDKITLQLKWHHQFQFAGYYAAQALDYYRDAGLDVTIKPVDVHSNPSDEVVSGRAEFGVASTDLLLMRDKKQPVVTLAAIFQHSPYVLLAMRRDGIESVHDLVGKKIFIDPFATEILAYLKTIGIPLEKLDLIQANNYTHEDLLSGRADAYAGYISNDPYYLENVGANYLSFLPRSGGIDFYGDNLFTTEYQVKHYPERVAAFRQASLRGWQYAVAHPEQVIDLMIEHGWGSAAERAKLQFEAEKIIQMIRPDLVEIGYMHEARWRHVVNTYADLGMLPRDMSLDGFIYGQDVPILPKWAFGALGIFFFAALLAGSFAAYAQRARKQLAAAMLVAEAANIAKSAFVANMSHEIRTPMNAIIGLAHMIRKGGLSREQERQLDTLESSGKLLLDIVNTILDLSKIEAGKFDLDHRVVDVPRLIRQIVDIVDQQVEAKGISLSVDSPQLPTNLVGDPIRLKQALLNYVSNAIKFTEHGQIEIRVRVIEEDAESALLRFDVKDTGIGISPDELQRLFSPFEQADNGTTRQYGGTGLGLTITKKFAQLMGGDAGASSEKGVGSNFWLTARLMKNSAILATHDAPEAVDFIERLKLQFAGARVLLVEDEPINQEIAAFILGEAGLVVDIASDGQEAVELAGTNPYALILMDMQMPKMDGLTATRQILQSKQAEKTPILAMTANAFSDDRERCLAAGMMDFITKPIEPELLYAKLFYWLSQQKNDL